MPTLSPQQSGKYRSGGPRYLIYGVPAPPPPITTNFGILQAVKAWWAGQTTLQALVSGGKIWHKSAPENASVEPYLTFFLVAEPVITYTTGYAYWESTVQFNVHHFLPDTAVLIAKQIADKMSSLKPGGISSSAPGSPRLEVWGQYAIHVLPDSFGIEEGEGLGLGGRDCWICHFEVSIPWTN